MKLEKVNIFGVDIYAGSKQDFDHEIIRILESSERNSKYICATSVHGIIEARSDNTLLKIFQNAFLNIPDGMPLVKYGHFKGYKHMQRMFGPDTMLDIINLSQATKSNHYYCGAMEGVAEKLSYNMKSKFPDINTSGFYSPPFRVMTESERLDLIDDIHRKNTDVLWIGISTPKQEKFINSLLPELKVKLVISVGAAFDFHTGSIRYAPNWMKNNSLEWLYRLISEPKRLWKRYFKIIPHFLILVLIDIFKRNN